MNLAPYITAYSKINLRWNIDLYVQDRKNKLQEENRRYIYDLRLDMNFLNKIHKALPKIKQNPDKLDFNKIMTIHQKILIIIIMKRQAIYWDKIFVIYVWQRLDTLNI